MRTNVFTENEKISSKPETRSKTGRPIIYKQPPDEDFKKVEDFFAKYGFKQIVVANHIGMSYQMFRFKLSEYQQNYKFSQEEKQKIKNYLIEMMNELQDLSILNFAPDMATV